MKQLSRVILTTSEDLLPPISGSNRKVIDLMHALKTDYHLIVVVYGCNNELTSKLLNYWGSDHNDFIVIEPRQKFSDIRALMKGSLRVTQAHRFDVEHTTINSIISDHVDTKLIIDGVTGAPLAEYYSSGVVISCNDCTSKMFWDEHRLNRNVYNKLLSLMRSWGSRNLERRYLHLADALHVVKEEDAECLRLLNPSIKPVVIPLASVGSTHSTFSSTDVTRMSPRILIWGNLALGNIRSGFVALLDAFRSLSPSQMGNLSVLGRISEREFVQLAGNMTSLFHYVDYTDNLDDFLNQYQIIIVPDLGGSGQKFRSLDALRLGRCLIGFDQAFSGFPVHSIPYFVNCSSPQEVPIVLERLIADGSWVDLSLEGQRVFTKHLSFEQFSLKWRELLERTAPLQPRI